jgi:hypothetical protein
MFSRLPSFLPLTFAATVGLFGLSSFLLAQQPPMPEIKTADIKRTQEENKKLFTRLSNDVLKLALRWEKSDLSEDQERAKTLRAVLKLIEEKGLDTLFKQLVEGIDKQNTNINDIKNLIGKDEKLIAALEEILKTLETEDEQTRLAREIKDLKELIKRIEQIKRDTENNRARTENPRSDIEKVAKEQDNLAKQTQELVAKPKSAPNPNANVNAKDDKSEPKPELKPGEASPEAKPDTQENKSDSKPAGESPDNPSGEPKPASKGGMDMNSAKDSQKNAPMASEPKGSETKPMGNNPMSPKGSESKPKTGDSKAQGDGKSEAKPSDSQAGAEGKPMNGPQSPPNAGQPSASKPSSGSPSEGQPSASPPSGAQPKQNDPAQENIQQAAQQQRAAEEELRKNDRNEASKKEDKAIQHLEETLKELEKRLKQLREKELAKLLGNLEERVNRMLRMQQEVYDATRNIHKIVVKNKNVKSQAELQKAQIEGDKEELIIAEADKALKLMEGEGSAVVFAGVLDQVKGDMQAVERRLKEGRVEGRNEANLADGTQLIEEDIIEQLMMMRDALKKAKQDLENQQNKPPGERSDSKPNQKLLNLINELKLIKSLQEQVNKRTVSYSKQDPGEQARDALIQAELKQLSDRQKVLQDMLHKIATEANQ